MSNLASLSSLSSLTPTQLRKAAGIQEQIEALTSQLVGILDGGSTPAFEPTPEAEPVAEPVKTRKKYKLSAVGRAKKVAAQKARWAKVDAAKATKTIPATKAEVKVKAPKRGGMSAEGKAKIVAAQKRRWAKVKAARSEKNPAKAVKVK
jgi:hypothetical protein